MRSGVRFMMSSKAWGVADFSDSGGRTVCRA